MDDMWFVCEVGSSCFEYQDYILSPQRQKSNPIRQLLSRLWLPTSETTKNSLSSGMATIILMYASLTFGSSAKDRVPPAEGSDFICMFMNNSTPETPVQR